MHPALQAQGYDPVADFAPVGLVGYCRRSSWPGPAHGRTVSELVAQLRSGEVRATYASAGDGTAPHFAGAVRPRGRRRHPGGHLRRLLAALTETVAGRTDLMFSSLFTAHPWIAAGRLRALAVAGPRRLDALPDLPTLHELGIAGVDVTQWYGVFAPAKTPAATVDELNAALNDVLARTDAVRLIAAQGIDVVPGSPPTLPASWTASSRHGGGSSPRPASPRTAERAATLKHSFTPLWISVMVVQARGRHAERTSELLSQPVKGDTAMLIRKALKLLYVQVLIGVVLGILVGYLFPVFGANLKVLGDLFVRLVKMMIAPVVFCTIVTGITSLTDSRKIGRTLGKSLGLFYLLTVLSLLIGLASVLILRPGQGLHIDPAHLDPSVAANATKDAPPPGFANFVLHIVPETFFGAFSDGEVLPVLLLAVLCGFGLSRIGGVGEPLLRWINSFSHMLFAVFGYLMRLAPLGAFGAMAFTVGRYGLKSIGSLGLLILTFYIACGIFVVVVLGVLGRIHGLSLWRLLRYFREELLVVLGTSSSEPVLPRLLMKLERLGCKRGVVGLVLPHRLLVQPRRHRHLPDARLAVHRAGHGRPPCRSGRSPRCSG